MEFGTEVLLLMSYHSLCIRLEGPEQFVFDCWLVHQNVTDIILIL